MSDPDPRRLRELLARLGWAAGPVAAEVEASAETFAGLEPAGLGKEAGNLHASLPATHRSLLAASDGMAVLFGSYRLFGFAGGALPDLVTWNAEPTWRFAWGGRADRFLFFGASVLGDPYAYRLADLALRPEPAVVELSAVTLDPVAKYPNFPAFFATFCEEPKTAHHARIRREREAAGSLPLDRFLAYAPSPLLVGGRADVQPLVSLPAAQAMILYGDVATQIGERRDLDGLRGLSPYTDEEGRERLRLEWESTA